MESLKGTRDFFPAQMRFRRWLERRWRSVAEAYGYEEVDAPVLEPLELYTRKSGDEIVRQLYRLTDQGRRELALRPEMTPSLARMLLGREASLPKPIRWYSIPRLFRYEKPQRGRLREFFQLNLDLFGVADESGDAELICATADVLRALNLDDDDFRIHVNDRRLVEAILEIEQVREDLKPKVLAVVDKLARTSFREAHADLTLAGMPPEDAARVLGVFQYDMPDLLQYASSNPVLDRAMKPLKQLRSLVSYGGAEEVLRFDLRIVRGIDYYTGIVFEVYATKGGLRAVCGGGRYDNLLAEFGGRDLPAVGFGMGDAVLEHVLKDRLPPLPRRLDVCVLPVHEENLPGAFRVASSLRRALREHGAVIQTSLRRQSLSKQLGRAVSDGARFAVLVGETERATNRYTVKDLERNREFSDLELEEVVGLVRDGGVRRSAP